MHSLAKRILEKKLTMQSTHQLFDLKAQLEDIVSRSVEGDVFETGVKFGGTAIFMVGVLSSYARSVKAADASVESAREFYFLDSFEGFRASPVGTIDALFNDHFLSNGPLRRFFEAKRGSGIRNSLECPIRM